MEGRRINPWDRSLAVHPPLDASCGTPLCLSPTRTIHCARNPDTHDPQGMTDSTDLQLHACSWPSRTVDARISPQSPRILPEVLPGHPLVTTHLLHWVSQVLA